MQNIFEKRVTRVTLLEKMRNRRLMEPNSSPQNQEKSISENKEKIFIPTLVKEWLEICLYEGHIEPSQPKVGKIIGWPQRSFLKESLFADLTCFCIKKGISKHYVPSDIAFYGILDLVFDLHGYERYVFPPLDVCQARYSKLID